MGSLAAGLAQSGEWIILARAAQGAGAAVVFSITVAMIGAVFPKQELGRAFGIFGLVATLALGLGPFVGGLVTELISWRVIFFLNLPLVVAVVVVIAAAWREPGREGPRPRFDYGGQLALMAMLLPLVLALTHGPDWGWGSPAVIALLAVAVLATPVFVLVERRSREPLIDFEVLARPLVAGCNVVVAGAQFTKIAVIVFGALYFQERLDMTPLGAGAALLTAMALTPITGSLAGSLVDRYGNRLTTLVGVAVGGVGLAWLGLFAPADEFLILVPGLLAWGASLQFFFSGPEAGVMAAVPQREQGQAGGVLTGTQMLGGSLAVAVLGGSRWERIQTMPPCSGLALPSRPRSGSPPIC